MGGDNKKKHKSNKKKKNKKPKDENNLQNVEDEHGSLEEPEENTLHDEEIESAISQKRQHAGDDSDSDSEPKKKKKKKKSVTVEDTSTDKKNKKSNRQKKKEKFALRQAELQAAAKGQLKSQCLNYLSQWKHDKSNWKFMKAKQVWLYKNKFSQNLLPSESWPLFMEYFESAKGNIRNMLLEDANKVIKQMDDWTESQDKVNQEETEESEETTETKKPDEIVYKRARDLIQCLQE